MIERLVEETGVIRILPETTHGKFLFFAILAVISAAVGISLTPGLPMRIPQYEPGEVARENLFAPGDLSIEDRAATAIRRSEAARSVFPVYDYDEGVVAEVSRRLAELFAAMRKTVKAQADTDTAAAEGIGLTRQTMAELRAYHWNENIENQIRRAAEQILKPGVIGSLTDLPPETGSSITVRRVPGGQEFTETNFEYITDLRGARNTAAGVIDLWIEDTTPKLRQAASEILREALRPNLSRNIQETERRRNLASETVKPVFVNFHKGELIVRDGERIEQQKIDLLALIRQSQKEPRWLAHFLILSASIFGFLFALVVLVRKHLAAVASRTNDLACMGILLVAAIAANRLLPPVWTEISVMASFAVVLRLIFLGETVFFWTVIVSVPAAFASRGDLPQALHYLIASWVGAAVVARTTSRSIVMRAGFAIGVVNAAAVLIDYQTGTLPLEDLRQTLLIAVIGGALATPTCVYVLVPMFERLFGYTSDLRLMELNNFDHPLIQKVFLQSPGTYHHSLIVGALSEAGVKEIGGNALLARVACMYHDIGKSLKPSFFVENLVEGQANPHLKLSPTMSALVIRSHVEEGIRIGRESRLPQAVIDMIPQHHGTKLMKFFFRKAQDARQPDDPPINDADFRYPGPKPQTREAGVIMLADACEAAARTLPDYSRARIQGMVQKLINDSFADGQLDECELTLKDLHAIARSFTRVISTFYHHRIKYPEPAEKIRAKIADPDVLDPDSEHGEDDEAPAEKSEGGRVDDLKRLGI